MVIVPTPLFRSIATTYQISCHQISLTTAPMEQMHDQFLEYAPITDSNTRKKRRDSELASNLTSKIEFGDSALFPSIVNRFGNDATGSNICSDKFGRFEFVERLLESEELAMIRSIELNTKQDEEEVGEGK